MCFENTFRKFLNKYFILQTTRKITYFHHIEYGLIPVMLDIDFNFIFHSIVLNESLMKSENSSSRKTDVLLSHGT